MHALPFRMFTKLHVVAPRCAGCTRKIQMHNRVLQRHPVCGVLPVISDFRLLLTTSVKSGHPIAQSEWSTLKRLARSESSRGIREQCHHLPYTKLSEVNGARPHWCKIYGNPGNMFNTLIELTCGTSHIFEIKPPTLSTHARNLFMMRQPSCRVKTFDPNTLPRVERAGWGRFWIWADQVFCLVVKNWLLISLDAH